MAPLRSWSGPALLAALTALRLAVAEAAPLSPDEAYYWVWSRALAPAYLDHPPMVALWIRAGTWIAGPTALGVRLLAPLSAAAGSLLLARLGGWRAALLLNATLLFGVGSVTMTPDTPLLFFWTVALWAGLRLSGHGGAGIQAGPGWLVLVAGAACGLALDSKYTALLLPLGFGLWLVWARQWRWLARPAFWGGVALAAGLFMPVVWWNARHRWASFAKQGGRGLVFDPGRAFGHLAELLAGQMALATPLIFALCVLGLWAACREAWRSRTPPAMLLAALTVPGIALFTEHALGDRVQANWPAVLYPSAVLAADWCAPAWRRRLFLPGLGLGLVLTGLVYVQTCWAPLPLSPRMDPTLRLSGGYAGLSDDVAAAAAHWGASFVAADEYGDASLLAILRHGCTPLVGIEPRWALFHLPDASGWMRGRRGLLLRSTRRRAAPDETDWIDLRQVGTLTRSRAGMVADRLDMFVGTARAGGMAAVLMPCPIS